MKMAVSIFQDNGEVEVDWGRMISRMWKIDGGGVYPCEIQTHDMKERVFIPSDPLPSECLRTSHGPVGLTS